MIDKYIFAAGAVTCNVTNCAFYIRAILPGKTKPHVFSWFIWTLTIGIAAAAQYVDHAGAGTVPMAIAAFNCLVIAVLSLFFGEKTITRSDWVAFLVALSAIPLWVATGNPLYAVILVALIDTIAFYPTYRKSWNKPRQENAATFAFFTLGSVMTCLAVENRTLVTMLYPVTLLIMEASVPVMLLWRRKVLGRP